MVRASAVSAKFESRLATEMPIWALILQKADAREINVIVRAVATGFYASSKIWYLRRP